jgi:hypothetical protein
MVTEDRFPGGLRCVTCKRQLEPGQPFMVQLYRLEWHDGDLSRPGVDSDDVEAHVLSVSVMTCVYCPVPSEDDLRVAEFVKSMLEGDR